jgi:hypothetical protein
VIVSAKRELDFTLSASAVAVEEVAEAEENEENNNEETEVPAEEVTEETEAPAEEVTEETEQPAEGTEEPAEEEVKEETEENEETEESEEPAEEPAEEAEEGTEEKAETPEEENNEENEGEEAEEVEENIDEEKEKMNALGCTKVFVTAEEGAAIYAEESREAEVIGHLDAGTEAWVILNEDQTWAKIYSEDEENAAQYISMEDAALKAEEAAEETEEITEAEKMAAFGCTKVVVTAEGGADLYAEESKEAEVLGHLDVGTEAWVILNEDQTWAKIFSEDEETAAQYISMEDAAIIADDEVTEEVDNSELQYEFIEKEVDVSIDMSFDYETFCTTALLTAVLDDYTEQNYTLQWQTSVDGMNWTDLEGETGEQMVLILNADNYQFSWRLVKRIEVPTASTEAAEEGITVVEVTEESDNSVKDNGNNESEPETDEAAVTD